MDKIHILTKEMFDQGALKNPEYFAEIEAAGIWEGNVFKISHEELHNINLKRYPILSNVADVTNNEKPTASINNQEPSLNDLAKNFTKALSKWVEAGVPVVSKETYESRRSVCLSCEFWDEQARMGLGKCKHSGCGCTKTKLWLATEKCPINKWSSPETLNA